MHSTIPSFLLQQRFMFLQGVCSPFFPRLADALRELGHGVRKINFTVGDRIYWQRGDAVSYRGPMEGLNDFYAQQFHRHGTTDIVLFGDCRPVHRPAIEIASRHNLRVHVYEEGYFRPFWITLEQGGVNGHSRLPRNPEWYKAQAKNTPQFGNGESFDAPFWKRAAYDVGYNFWAGMNPLLHKGVQSHVPYTPLTEYLGYLRRGIRIKRYEGESRRVEAKLIVEAQTNPFFLMPLQLANDAQIVHHSPFKNMAAAMHMALESFAKFAPENSRLAVKIHPLDPGLVDYRFLLTKRASELGIADRTLYLESGNLPALLAATAGVVTVNSTVGGSSLIHNRPTIALGTAVYNLPGLTFQHGLDNFWKQGQKPDSNFYRKFRNVVIAHSQVNGGFYSEKGIRLAIKNSLPKLLNQSLSPQKHQSRPDLRHKEPIIHNRNDL
jgi:capsular polysaccharide export protein